MKTILLVEDEALIALGETAILKRHGYGVITANSGTEAVETALSNKIDLILMDIDLGKGKMDGTEAAEIILEKQEIPIVFLSSHTEKEMVDKTEKITSYGYVVKNLEETVLCASIKMAFKLFEANQQIKEREQALLQEREKYRLLIDTVDDILYSVDIESGEFVYVSPSFERVLGYSLREIREMGGRKQFLSQVMQDHAFEQQLGILEKFMREGGDRPRHVAEWKTKDGTVKILEDYWVPVYENGTMVYAEGVLRDITFQRDMENRYQVFFEYAKDALILTDYQTDRIINVNKKTCEMLGYSKKELLDMRITDVQAPEVRGPKGKTIREELDNFNGTPFRTVDIRKDKSLVDVEVTTSFIQNINNGVVLSIVRDLSMRDSERAT